VSCEWSYEAELLVLSKSESMVFPSGIRNFNTIINKIITSGCITFKENTSPGKSLYFLDPDGHKLEIHVGTPEMRIAVKKADAGHWKNVEWFV
jgi:hypothetical protein